ncbi:ABC transporter permease [Bdellovibrio reynosensis]|uniref:ABC transporter permease subunit n=1 Tax=Bdellovibrio reynosensis TaxID=2835041 RepID=A0ABY4CAP6_9BACT|nr:ABC transporter permease subunit [Bdellovibrio reynosensis]UOF01849.1 ABC transporter permease subunit [Bdellovibrio reynosensis]
MSSNEITMNDLEIDTAALSAKDRAEIEKAQPMWKMVLKQFMTHKLAVVGAGIITLFMLVSIFASQIQSITDLDPDNQNVANRYLPPMTTATVGQDVRETEVEKFINASPEAADKIQKALVEKGVVAVAEADSIYELAAQDVKQATASLENLNLPEAGELVSIFKEFETFHLFGTDELGRDVFIRLIYGTQVSMGVGVLVAIASALIGLLIGSLAGFYGGLIDTMLMRVTDALLSLPTIPVLIVMAAIDLTKLPWLNAVVSSSNQSIFKMVIILCLFSWMTVARLVRGSILSIREREFVLAARTLGAKDSTIIVRHMFPNVIAPMLVSITLGVGESILFEAALSFLGLGIMPPTPSWGNMLNNAQELIYQAPFLAILPGILILLTTMSFNYLGDGLQDAIDPKAIRR